MEAESEGGRVAETTSEAVKERQDAGRSGGSGEAEESSNGRREGRIGMAREAEEEPSLAGREENKGDAASGPEQGTHGHESGRKAMSERRQRTGDDGGCRCRRMGMGYYELENGERREDGKNGNDAREATAGVGAGPHTTNSLAVAAAAEHTGREGGAWSSGEAWQGRKKKARLNACPGRLC